MGYRDDVEALSARHDALADEVAERHRELAATKALLDEAAARANRPVLDSIRVASPCPTTWEAMVGDERVRHCGACDKDVFNLSAMTRDEAEALIAERVGNLCARYYQRADGTIITSDCTVGIAKRRRRRVMAAGIAALLAGAGGLALILTRRSQPRGVLSDDIAFDHRDPSVQVELAVVPPPPPVAIVGALMPPPTPPPPPPTHSAHHHINAKAK
jgi:hypothetical protein